MLCKKLEKADPEVDPLHDFRNFLYHIFVDVLKFGAPHPIQYDIASYMMELRESSDGMCRKQIQAMRGCGKSVIAAAYCVWCWYVDPTIRILYLGSNQDLVDLSVKLIKQILDNSPFVEHLRPQDQDKYQMRRGRKIKDMGQATNKTNTFDIRGAGPGRDESFAARPVFGGWTGRHPDLIIADDCEIPENSLTELKRKRLESKLLECESLINGLGVILYMGTPQTEDSIYTKLHTQGYTLRRWPAELPDPDDIKQSENCSPWILDRARAGEAPGSPSYPERFPVEVLLEKMAKSRTYYNLQMLLNPSLLDAERYPLKLRQAIVMDVPSDMAPMQVVWGTLDKLSNIEHGGRSKDCWVGPAYVSDEWGKYQTKLMYVDPKGGGADSVGYCVLGTLNGMVFILDAGGLSPGKGGTSDATMEKIAKIAQEFEVPWVVVESNWGGSKEESAYARLLQPVLARICGPTQVTLNYVPSTQKEVRILDCLEPVFNSHRVIFTTRAAGCVELSYQLTRITRERGSLPHDDVIDAVYGAVSQVISQVVLDPQKREEDHRERERKATVKEFDEYTKKTTRWLDGGPKVKTKKPHRSIARGTSGTGRWRKC